MIRRVISALAALGLAWAPLPLQAASISPMVVDVEPVGRASVGRVELANPGSKEFPVEVQMFRGEIGELGELTLFPADEQFLVFPAQAVIPAEGQQVFRVQYVGEPELGSSQIYYMAVKQIPVELEPGPPRVQIVVNFNVLVNVVPDGTAAEPVVEYIRPATRDGVTGVEVRLANRGTRYFAASRANWTVSGTHADGTDGTFTKNQKEMASLIGVGVVPPGGARVFFIPTAAPLVEENLSVSMGT